MLNYNDYTGLQKAYARLSRQKPHTFAWCLAQGAVKRAQKKLERKALRGEERS